MNGNGYLIKIKNKYKKNKKIHKIKHGSSFKKPLYLNELFGN